MKRTNRGLALVIALMLATTAGTALAQTTARARPKRPGQIFQKVLRCLQIVDLTDDQKTQIRDIFEAARPTLEALGQELRADQETLQSLLQEESPDACAIGSAFLEVRDDEAAIRDETRNVLESIRTVLSAEQQAKLAGCLEAPRDAPPSTDGQ